MPSRNRTHHRRTISTRVVGALLIISSLSPLSLANEWRYSGVQRIVAISDVHGAFDPMVSTLQSANVLDESTAWSGGRSHLVITGDLLDRGPDSRRVVDLIRRLEDEALNAGGQVHLLLGNHEVMNLVGDTRYVSNGEYAAFSREESAEEREFWFQHFREKRVTGTESIDADERSSRTAFEKKTPPGFFAHRRAFSIDGEYGRWLAEKPLMIVINDTVFVHGGMSPFVVEHGVEGVNSQLKTHLIDYMAALKRLEQSGVLSPIDQFREHPAILTSELNARGFDPELSSLAETALALYESPLHGPEGPLWYRGNSTCSGLVEADALNAALEKAAATRAVIGHTTTKTRQVQQRFNGRVVEINTGMLASSYGGSGYALVIENGAVSVVSERGDTGLLPVSPPLRVGERPDRLDDGDLSRILSRGVVLDTIPADTGRSLVRIRAGTETILAYFDKVPAGNESVPELAAYRLDRILGLNMVPLTVRRVVAGFDGTLQLASPNAHTEFDRVASNEDDSQPCPVDKQLQTMRVFDALINNEARTPNSMLYVDDDWQLMLVNHGDSFGESSGRAMFATESTFAIGSGWRDALAEISDEELHSRLGDVLSSRHLNALKKRRDALARAGTRQREQDYAH